MSYQHDRDTFMHQAAGAGLSVHTAERLLRYASTLQRLAVAQCNGDWPYEHGDRTRYPLSTCARCEGRWATSSMRRAKLGSSLLICPDCRTQDKVRALLQGPYVSGASWEARFSGDPRGYVLRLVPRGTSDEQYQCGLVRTIYVPGRER